MKVDISEYQRMLHEGKLELILKGLPGAKGIAIGYVRVGPTFKSIRDSMQRGDVVVVPLTYPPDVPYLVKNECSAIVTDRGGITTHAVLFSQSRNIPCVPGTGNATKVLENYDGKILVDGNAGRVYKVKEG